MKFRLKLLWFEIEIETPEPVQVSPADVAAAIWTAMANADMIEPVMLPVDDDTDD